MKNTNLKIANNNIFMINNASNFILNYFKDYGAVFYSDLSTI